MAVCHWYFWNGRLMLGLVVFNGQWLIPPTLKKLVPPLKLQRHADGGREWLIVESNQINPFTNSPRTKNQETQDTTKEPNSKSQICHAESFDKLRIN